jgi:hypothetical protein
MFSQNGLVIEPEFPVRKKFKASTESNIYDVIFGIKCNTQKRVSVLNSPSKQFHILFFFHGAVATGGPGHYRGFTIILRQTTLGRNALNE